MELQGDVAGPAASALYLFWVIDSGKYCITLGIVYYTSQSLCIITLKELFVYPHYYSIKNNILIIVIKAKIKN